MKNSLQRKLHAKTKASNLPRHTIRITEFNESLMKKFLNENSMSFNYAINRIITERFTNGGNEHRAN